jgi:hypothetical protein
MPDSVHSAAEVQPGRSDSFWFSSQSIPVFLVNGLIMLDSSTARADRGVAKVLRALSDHSKCQRSKCGSLGIIFVG